MNKMGWLNFKKKDDYIHMLEFGASKGFEGFREEELKEYFKEKNIKIKHNDLFNNLFGECFRRNDTSRSERVRFALKPEYYFRLLEYRELELATKAANSAKVLSLIAISIAIISVLASVFIGMKPVKLDKNQLQQLTCSMDHE